MKNRLQKVVITGGAGFIGSNLISHLYENGTDEILIIDDFSTGSRKNIDHFNNLKIIDSRIEDIADLESKLEGYDFCFHLAAGVGVKYIMDNVSKALNTNIQATHKIFNACSQMNVPILITSTSEVYGVSNDPVWTEESKSLLGPPTKLRWSYATSKLIDEFMALAEFNDGNLNPIIVRLFNIIGSNQSSEFGMVVPKFVEAALENRDIIIHGSGDQTRSFTWVGDVVNYFRELALLKPYGEIFNIGQPEEVSIKNLAELVIKKSNSSSKIKFISHEEEYGKAFEDPMRRTPGIDKIVSLTGIRPSKKLEEMIEEIIEFKKQH
ncbi:NAD-dependent epimerase/dehydratase family protein [Acidimicrobiaceae bacterium]|nr:NAD-dependent epimerase/dehydratase family protein [Acidimicrobiaceae bacterium]